MSEYIKNIETDDEMVKKITSEFNRSIKDIGAVYSEDDIVRIVSNLSLVISNKSDELEELHAAYGNAQKEIATLKAENERLEKSNYKMRGKNQKQGAKVLRLENELRRTDSEKWDKYKKEMK